MLVTVLYHKLPFQHLSVLYMSYDIGDGPSESLVDGCSTRPWSLAASSPAALHTPQTPGGGDIATAAACCQAQLQFT
jgi:hypothetical protein